MSSNNIKPGFIRSMQVIHLALIAGVGVFLVFVIALVLSNGGGFMGTIHPDLNIIFLIIAAMFGLLGSAIGIMVFEKNMKDAKRYTFIKEKALIFRTSFLIRMALHELGAFVGIVLFMLSGDYLLLLGTAICLLAIIGARPTAGFITYKLYLTKEEGEAIAAI